MAPETVSSKSWLPTRKWWANLIVGAGAVATSAIGTGWDSVESLAVVALVVQLGATYVLPNADTPGGVPLRRRGPRRSSWSRPQR